MSDTFGIGNLGTPNISNLSQPSAFASGINTVSNVAGSAVSLGGAIASLIYLDRTFDAQRELRRVQRRRRDNTAVFDAFSRRNAEISRATSGGFSTSFGSLAFGARAATQLNEQRAIDRQTEVIQSLQLEQMRIAAIGSIVTETIGLGVSVATAFA